MECLKASNRLEARVLMTLRWILAPSLGQLLLLPSCLYSAVVMPSHLERVPRVPVPNSLLSRIVNNATTKGRHLIHTALHVNH